MRNRSTTSRNGVVLVLLLVAIITLFAFVALAIDLGMLAVARTQLQDAADVTAMAGTRTLNGDMAANNNYSLAGPNAITAATANSVLSKPIASSQVNLQIGRYVYTSGPKRFEGQFPGPTGENWSMVNAQISANVTNNMAFAKVFNFGSTNMQATATAAHRPRDVAVVVDFSGSMRFASLAGLNGGSSSQYSGSRTKSNNPDPVFPQFGHYSAVSTAGLQATTFTNPYEAANITTTTSDGRPPIINDFYSDAIGTLAFAAASSGYATVPGGDNYLKIAKNSGATYCTTAADLLGLSSVGTSTRDATFETSGYPAYGMVSSFSGYTVGPGYWGKSFFVWPPDPRAAFDWRVKYFGTNDNSRLWVAGTSGTAGNWRAPSGTTYAINYAAILNFIKNTGTNPFPSRLQSGRILYYDQIPDTISSTYPPTDLNQRFWKDYIDYVLGLIQSGSSTWTVLNHGTVGYAGYGPDYTSGSLRITATSSLTGTPKPYMHYLDNPKRPRTHFWFGPLTMIDFLDNYNMWSHASVSPSMSRFCWWPGTCHESPMYACKLGIRAALSDIETNHPNNLVSLITFSAPNSSAGGTGRFNRVRVGLGRDYARMQESLWYPPKTLGNSSMVVRPYDSDNLEVPRAMGSTCYAMGLMLAYNQFSAHTSLTNYNPAEPAGDAGGNGRKGAQKVVIFETDGAPNTSATASFVNSGAHNSYYAIRYNSANPSASQFPTGVSSYSDLDPTVTTQINAVCTRIAALETASPPGYSTPSKKALVHCIGFGPVFAPGSSTRTASIAALNQMQTLGNVTDGMPAYKIIYGTETQMVDNLQQAFTQILQSGVQVSLLH